MSFGKRLKERREQLHITQSQLAEKLGITKGAVGNYENGVSSPKEEILLKIFDTLEVEPNYLFQDSFTKSDFLCSLKEQEYIKKYRSLEDHGKDIVNTILDKEYEYQKSLEQQSLKNTTQETEHAYLFQDNRMYMTQYDYGVSAGIGNFLDEWDIPKSIVPVNDTPMAHKADYILKVDGESMMPTYADGDRVFVKAQETVNMNEMGIFIIDGKCYLKQYKGDHLHSLNQDYEDIPFVEEQNIKCVGKVLGKVWSSHMMYKR